MEQQENYKTVAEDNFKTRLIAEEKQVRERIAGLTLFISSEKFKTIEPDQARLLLMQATTMSTYQQILIARLELLLSVQELKELLEQM